MSFVLFVAAAYVLVQLGVSDAWLLVVAVLLYVVVVRPLMRPVREAVGLRRRLAYQAFLHEREQQEQP